MARFIVFLFFEAFTASYVIGDSQLIILKSDNGKSLLSFSKLFPDISITEEDLSPFELLSADEIWMTNTISGIVPVTNYRKKMFSNVLARRFLETINNHL